MRLFRFCAVLLLVGVVGWLVVRTVSVESTPEDVRITIDKRELKQAGHKLKAQGRKAADTVGEALERAGQQLDDGVDRGPGD